ncbi:hypothetical protein Csa_014600 [Cucumis sativus]|uniref:Uncharacterized protein n=1 Tax=Cucumis sativus TaxID=3659 RepID=A0A0A0KTP0_CUCSA|nr:hypothetical protein Csa_014600 [Cucumis sativus]
MEQNREEELKTFKSLGTCEQLVEACWSSDWKPHGAEGKVSRCTLALIYEKAQTLKHSHYFDVCVF